MRRTFTPLDFHEPGNIVVMVLYWGSANFLGNGQTPGKWVARTRTVSLTSDRMGLWQSIERGLGYGAMILELGLGALQAVSYTHLESDGPFSDRIAALCN